MKTGMKTISSSKLPRVLVINSAKKWVGEAEHTFNLISGLLSRKVRTILVCRKGYGLEQEAINRGIEHYTVLMKGKFTGIHDLFDFLELRRIIKKHRINLVHCHRGKDHWLSACVKCSFLFSKPRLIRTRHVTVPVKRHIFNRWLYKYSTDDVIAVSEEAAGSLKGLPLRHAPHIIYAAVDAEKFSPGKRSADLRRQCGIPEDMPEAPLIGLIGRIQTVKGQQILIRAMKEILETIPEARFVIAAKSSERKLKRPERLAKKLGVEDKIHITGHFENIEELVASLDVGVVASLGSEGSSRITMEYMASGVPVVATMVGGIPEILEGGRLGTLVSPNNAEELSSAVSNTILNRDQAMKKAEAALQKARTFLTLDRFMDQTLGVYQSVLKNRGEAPPYSSY